jgi:hypothetical protein
VYLSAAVEAHGSRRTLARLGTVRVVPPARRRPGIREGKGLNRGWQEDGGSKLRRQQLVDLRRRQSVRCDLAHVEQLSMQREDLLSSEMQCVSMEHKVTEEPEPVIQDSILTSSASLIISFFLFLIVIWRQRARSN